MKQYYIEIGRKDTGETARLLHNEDCKKLINPEKAVSLARSPTTERALEKAKRLFRDTEKCPHCAVTNQTADK